jgi:RimJ/RimL family protein N-acetyltransferase
VSARRLTEEERATAEPFVAAYPYKPYRHYRVLSRKAQNAVMMREIVETLEHPSGVVLHLRDEGREALAVARLLDWDSTFFAIPMARIDYVLSSTPEAAAIALDEMLDGLRARGVSHVTARVDVADIGYLALLEAAGFRLMDSLVTYTTRPGKEPPNPVREVGVIRDFTPEDGPQLLEIAAEAYRGFRGRFHLDPHIPDERCDAFYRVWAEQSIAMVMADTILVAEGSDRRLLGFLAFRKRQPVSSVGGVDVFGGGLGACRSDTPGAYAGLIRAGTVWAHARNGVAECQTQNYNFATIRIYEAVGAHYVQASYTLHKWLGT